MLRDAQAPAATAPGAYAGSCIDAHVAELSAAGEITWQLPFGTRDGVEFASSLALAADGGVYIGGLFDAPLVLPGLSPLGSQGGSDFFVIALDGHGAPRWSRGFGSSMEEGDGVQLALNAQGELAVRGNFTQAVAGGFAALLAADGGMRWQRDVPQHSLSHVAWSGDELLIPSADALISLNGRGELASRALPGARDAAHISVLPNGHVLTFRPGTALIEATAAGVPIHSLTLGDKSTPWYHGGMCASREGAIAITGNVDQPSTFGFLPTPLAAESGEAFVVYFARWPRPSCG